MNNEDPIAKDLLIKKIPIVSNKLLILKVSRKRNTTRNIEHILSTAILGKSPPISTFSFQPFSLTIKRNKFLTSVYQFVVHMFMDICPVFSTYTHISRRS